MPFRYDFEVDRLFRCPQNPDTFDAYTITLIADQMIVAEEIDSVLKSIAATPVYQEIIAATLAKRFTCKAMVVGTHHVAPRDYTVVAEVNVKDLLVVNARPLHAALKRVVELADESKTFTLGEIDERIEEGKQVLRNCEHP